MSGTWDHVGQLDQMKATLEHHTCEELAPSLDLFHCAHNLFSCVGVWQNDHIEIIANDQGNRTTPSYVYFSDNKCLIGDAAKNEVTMNPHITFNEKRLIGHNFDDPEVQSDVKHFPFKVFSDSGKPYIRVEYRGEDKEFVRIASFALRIKTD